MAWLRKLFGKSENPYQEELTPEFAALLDASRIHLATLTEAHQGGWRFGQQANWGLNQDEGVLRFTFADGRVAEAPAQAVGSYSEADRSWMWAWGNPSISEGLKRDSLRVRQYGEEHAIGRLTRAQWKADMEWAWSMTALTVKLCDAQGAYCGSAGPTRVFLAFGEVRLSKA
jgi:hypothetical protein